MEADWDELNRIISPAASNHGPPSPPTAIAFDTRQELLWIGNESGRILAYNGPDLRRYISYRGHKNGDGPVKQFLFHERGVISVAPTSIHFASRRGLTIWHIEHEAIKDLRCMSFMGKEQDFLLVAGIQQKMFKIDIEKGRIVEEIHSDYEYQLMKQSKYICAATTTGSINILDVDTLRIVKTFSSNSVQISDMDARNNYLVTCGWMNRAGAGPILAGFANSYDLRAMVQLPPIPFHMGAAHSGQMHVVDLMNLNTVNLRQANMTSYTRAFVLAPSGDALVLVDGDGVIHLWGSPNKIRFAEYPSTTLEWGQPQEVSRHIEINSNVSFNDGIGMPYYREQLFSSWPGTTIYNVGEETPKIDPLLLQQAKLGDIGRWSRNSRRGYRNVVEKKRVADKTELNHSGPKFLSEKARALEKYIDADQTLEEVQDKLTEAVIGHVTKSDIPIMYRNVEIRYSKFGVEDFDFVFYNKTKYSGLETHIANSYMNALLQLLKFVPLFRNLALQHTATACFFDTCLLCELGFLFDTMEKAEGLSCQASNFLKTFGSIPQANRMALLEETNPGLAIADMIQGACRFLLQQTKDDYHRRAPLLNLFEETLAVDAIHSIQCVFCRNESIKPAGGYITDLAYIPLSTPGRGQRPYIPTFSQVLKASVELQTQTRGWCDKCRKYQQLATRKGVRKMPDVLMINAALKSVESRHYWAIPGWLPDSIGIVIDQGKFFCFEGEDLRLHLQKGLHVVKVYDLVGIVADVASSEKQKSHLVSLINVDIFSNEVSSGSDWHLFNDFLVRKMSKVEALEFPPWKTPTVIAYHVSTARGYVDSTWKDHLDTTLLYNNWSINNRSLENCSLLDPSHEAPWAGTCVAIDTEFVTLQHGEIELKADGMECILRPNKSGLARVSVLRGSGPNEGTPFINDYITIREDIVDYVTQFSGIVEGDLDPRYSPHNLVPLKIAYKKLWLLVNLGCVFIGHGLPKDFRTVNIHVPQDQVIDTGALFFIKSRQRKLSLRFLAWYLLKEEIQQVTHDSIEDARIALRLWRKYEEFRDAGIVEPMLEEIYREGKKTGFKPPSEVTTTGEDKAARDGTDGMLAVPGSLHLGNGFSEAGDTPAASRPSTPGRRYNGNRRMEGFESPLR